MKKLEVICMSLLIALLLFGCAQKSSSLQKTIIKYIDKQDIAENVTIHLSDFTDFDWDKIIVFEPMASKTDIEKENDITIEETIDVFGGIMFVYKNKVVYSEFFEQSFDGIAIFNISPYITYDPSTRYITLTKENAIFQCTRTQKDTEVFYRLFPLK